MSYLTRLKQANTADLGEYRPLLHDGHAIGLLWLPQIDLLRQHGLRLKEQADSYCLNAKLDCTELSQALSTVIISLHSDGRVPGWRDELYALSENHHRPPAALIERAAMPLFGGCGYGVHINGLTMRDNTTHLWIARRAWDKPTEPGKLDQIAAGGIPHGISVFANMQKECDEEAGIPAELTANAKAVSTSSYFYQVENGIRADILFNYDLWLPEHFTPINRDGEVAEFMCLPIEEVMAQVEHSDAYKFNANIVLIDLFVRHGYLTPAHPDYEAICALLNPRHPTLSATFSIFKTLL